MKTCLIAVFALAALAAAAPHRRGRGRRKCPAHHPTPTMPPVHSPDPTTTEPAHDPTTTADPTTTEQPPVETSPASSGGGGGFNGPVFSVYADVGIDAGAWPTPDDLGDWNDLLISFFLTDGRNAFDIAAVWEGIDGGKKDEIIKSYHDAGKKIRVSLFGSTDMPLQHGGDPVAIGNQLAQWVKDNKLDGVDLDYEDSGSFNSAGDGENFLITLTKTLRQKLPAPYIISHAPQAPYFTTAGWYPQGAYTKIHKEVGSLIDFYNIQFYNQGDGMYEDCDSLFNGGGSTIAGTSVNEIISQGIPANKVIIGKPGAPSEAGNGYMSPQDIGSCIKKQSKKPGGVMSWQWNSAKADWVAAAKGDL